MSGEGVKLTLSSATLAELKAACKKQAGQIKLLKETLQRTKDELANKEGKEEENSVKIGALNQCIQDLTKEMDAAKEKITVESEKKLEIWKTRAKDRITQLETALRDAQEGGSSPKAGGDAVAKLTVEMDTWKQRAKEKIRQLEAALQEARSKTPTETSEPSPTVNAELTSLREEYSSRGAALKEAQDKVVTLNAALERSATWLQEVRTQLSDASAVERALASAQRDVGAKDQRIEVLEAASKQTTVSLEELKAKLAEAKTSEENHKGRTAVYEGQLRQLNLKVESLEEAAGGAADFGKLESSYKREIESLQQQVQNEKKHTEELEARVEDLSFFEEMQGKDSTGDIERLEDELRKVNTTLGLAQNEVTQLKAKQKKTEADLKQKEKQAVTLAQDLEATRSEAERKVGKLQEQSEQYGLDADERLRAVADDFERYKERSKDAITRRTMEVTSLKEVAQAAEESARELRSTCDRMGAQLTEKDTETMTLQSEVDALQEVLDACREEARMLESKLEMQYEVERKTLVGTHAAEMESLREALESRISEAQTMHEREYSEKIHQTEDTLEKARTELRLAKEQATRATEEKEREIFRASVQVKELKKRIEELEIGSSGNGGNVPLAVAGRSWSEPTQPVNLGSLELGRDMMLLAQQQANRDWEMQQYQEEIERLGGTVKDLTQQRDSQLQRLNSLSSEAMEQESSKNRGKVNMDYLKNILVKFLSERNKVVQAGLVPVIATMLELSQKERALIKKEFPGAKV